MLLSLHLKVSKFSHYQWLIKGRGLGDLPPPLFLDPTEAQRAE